jgi:hypothetical protein
MIDRKKLVQRLNKGSKLKEYPLLNLYILVAAFFEIIGELFDSSMLKKLKPLPLLLMVIYIHCKNSSRKHLVPNLVEVALFLFLLLDTISVVGDESSNVVAISIKMIVHLVLCVSFSFGDNVRFLLEFRILRKLAYLAIIGATSTILYFIQEQLENKVVYSAYFFMLAFQLCVALWRYEITLRSSYLFSLFGSGLMLISGWLNLWVGGIGTCLVQLLYYCGSYFLMHGALHQSNLQFEIDKLQDNMRRTY